MAQQNQQSHTDIKHLIEKARDAFDVSSWGGPEREPHPAPKEYSDHIEMHEVVEHEHDAEVQEYVQNTQHVIKLPKDLRKLDVEYKEGPIQYPSYKTVTIPLSDDQIVKGLKDPISSSLRWLAEQCLYLLKKANIRLEIAHGKAERVVNRKKS
jgi:hypothetical protein